MPKTLTVEQNDNFDKALEQNCLFGVPSLMKINNGDTIHIGYKTMTYAIHIIHSWEASKVEFKHHADGQGWKDFPESDKYTMFYFKVVREMKA